MFDNFIEWLYENFDIDSEYIIEEEYSKEELEILYDSYIDSL